MPRRYHSVGRVLSSFVRSVGLSIGNDRVFWKNGRFHRNAVLGVGQMGPR